MLKTWLAELGLTRVRVNASLLLPYFDFEGQGQEGTGVHAEARNFQLNTDAALQYLRSSGTSCFDHVYLIGSDIKARYGFSDRRPLPKQRCPSGGVAGGGWDYVIVSNQPPSLATPMCSAVPQRIRSAGTTFPIMRSLVRASPAEPGLRWPG